MSNWMCDDLSQIFLARAPRAALWFELAAQAPPPRAVHRNDLAARNSASDASESLQSPKQACIRAVRCMPLLPCVILASGRRRRAHLRTKITEQRIVVQVFGPLLIS
jgi:hypothetical protein